MKLRVDPLAVRQACYEQGMLVGTAGGNVLRLAPPLIVDEANISEAVAILDRALSSFREKAKAA
jgi:acetylornithine/N-succinyldiaminopimelate aminotransferase